MSRGSTYAEIERARAAIERIYVGELLAYPPPAWRHPIKRMRWNRQERSLRFTANYLAAMGWDPDAERESLRRV